jgi:porin
VKFQSSSETNVKIGIYQVNPAYVSDSYAQAKGLSLDDPDKTTGALIPLEFAWTPQFQGHPGSYKLGIWYNTSKAADLSTDVNDGQMGTTGKDPMIHSGQYGAYINFEQGLIGTEKDPKLSVFLNISQADRNTAAVDRQISLGTQYYGPFDRHDDTVGFAVAATDNNSRYADFIRQNNARTGQNQTVGDGNEYVSEVYYSYAPIASFFLRPNLQYILHPGGLSSNSNAFIAGLKTGITF